MDLPKLPAELLASAIALVDVIAPAVDRLVEDEGVAREQLPKHEPGSDLSALLGQWESLTGEPPALENFEGLWRSQSHDEFATRALIARCAPVPPQPDEAAVKEIARLAAPWDHGEEPTMWGPGVFEAEVYQSWLDAWSATPPRVLLTPPPQ